MSCLAWHDEDGLVYYELRCDRCQTPFVCYDDACYDWRLLRDAAMYCGWDTRQPNPTGPHHCPACHQHTRARSSRRNVSAQGHRAGFRRGTALT